MDEEINEEEIGDEEEAEMVGAELSCRMSGKQRGEKEVGSWEGTACATMTWRDKYNKAHCHRGTGFEESFA